MLNKKKLAEFKILIFDFDGVLYDTVEAKIEGFAKVAQQADERLAELTRNFLLENFGKPRDWFVSEICRKANEELGVRVDPVALKADIDFHVAEAVKSAKMVSGAREILVGNKAFVGDRYIVSGGPKEDALHLLKRDAIQLDREKLYFSVGSKSDQLGQIMRQTETSKDSIAFIGDSPVDFEAAIEAGIDFVYRPSEVPFPDEYCNQCFAIVKDLKELMEL